MEYTIVFAEQSERLIDEVNRKLSEGWTLVGGPFSYSGEGGYVTRPSGAITMVDYHIGQAMTRTRRAVSQRRTSVVQKL